MNMTGLFCVVDNTRGMNVAVWLLLMIIICRLLGCVGVLYAFRLSVVVRSEKERRFFIMQKGA